MSEARVRDLEEVYRLRYTHFLRVATAIAGDEDAGHDAVQDGFASALRHRRTFRGEGPLEAWVWRVVVNAAKKARVARTRTLDVVEGSVSNGAHADEVSMRAWIAGLPERQRLAVFLRYYADLDYRSIASVLGIEVGTVSATLASAHSTLRKQLTEAQS
ncbi:MAG TPA: sigma-70 family RNA polymerase sigma factor [Gaiellaceae bacterium]|nr:sigma-70 family RNA polymerase sigma factor [Gaiellaceae bacterium]